jgi:transposase-like protein
MQDIRTTDTDLSPTPKRRNYPSEFKAQIVRQSQMPAASVAGIALQHRINPVTLHRWIREAKQKQTPHVAAFVPLRLDLGAGIHTGTSVSSTAIHIELQRAGTVIRVEWPVFCAGECAAWMREVLK